MKYNRFARLSPQSAPAAGSSFPQRQSEPADTAELPAPWIDRGPDYEPGDADDPLDMWPPDLIALADGGGTCTIWLSTGEVYHASWATLRSRGWIRLADADWLNGPERLRGVRRPTLAYRANIAKTELRPHHE